MQQNKMGQNIIITEPSSNLRALGRNALKGKWKLAILTIIVFQLCLQVPPAILNALFGTKTDILSGQTGVNVDVYSSLYNTMPSTSALASLYVILVTGAFTLGISLVFLAMFRRQQTGVSDVFLGFEHFGKALGLMLFQSLFILLWSLLFIVPGIIASIRYSQVFYILADDPSKSIRQCMNESKVMMKGNKSKFFCLSLSFIGWALLAGLPTGIIEGIAAVLYAPALVQSIVLIIASLFIVPVIVYMYSTMTGFYEILAGHLIKETEPAPITEDAVPTMVEPVTSSGDSQEITANTEAPVETGSYDEVSTAKVNVADILNEDKNEEKDEDDFFPKEV